MEFDTVTLPSEPAELFGRWLGEAVDHGVPEPHAMTLSTCDADGHPDARVLILKDLDDAGCRCRAERGAAGELAGQRGGVVEPGL